MINKLLKNCGLLILLSVFIISCKKNKIEEAPKDVLTGAWAEVPQSSYNRRLLFEPGGKFSMEIMDKNNQYWALVLSGKYSISGDNLSVNVTSESEKTSNGVIIKTSPINYTLFDKGKFSIENYILTINYVTYPADAPAPTTIKLGKIIPID